MASHEAEQRDRRRQLDRLWGLRQTRRRRPIGIGARRFLEESMHLEDPALYPDEYMIAGVIDWFIQDGLPAWERWSDAAGRQDDMRQGTEGGRAARSSRRPTVNGRTVARRLHRLDDVAQLVVPFANLARGSLDWGDRPISWPNVAAKLNPSHPDPEKLGEALERAFRRDRRDPRLCALYFDSEFRDWAKQADYLRPILRCLELGGRRPEDLFVRSASFDSSKLSDSLPPEIAEVWARAGWPKEWLVVSAKYPAELVRSRQVVVLGGGTADKEARQRSKLLLCKGRACDFTSRMLIWWSPGATAIFKSPQCAECAVASRMMSKLPSD